MRTLGIATPATKLFTAEDAECAEKMLDCSAFPATSAVKSFWRLVGSRKNR